MLLASRFRRLLRLFSARRRRAALLPLALVVLRVLLLVRVLVLFPVRSRGLLGVLVLVRPLCRVVRLSWIGLSRTQRGSSRARLV